MNMEYENRSSVYELDKGRTVKYCVEGVKKREYSQKMRGTEQIN